jgi:hypothetical protein
VQTGDAKASPSSSTPPAVRPPVPYDACTRPSEGSAGALCSQQRQHPATWAFSIMPSSGYFYIGGKRRLEEPRSSGMVLCPPPGGRENEEGGVRT